MSLRGGLMTRACCAEGGKAMSRRIAQMENGEIGPNVWRGLFLACPLAAPPTDLLPTVAPLQGPPPLWKVDGSV